MAVIAGVTCADLNRAMDPLDFKFINTLRPPCAKCGRPLVLTRIEPEKPGFDRRIYYCMHCQSPEFVTARV